MKIGEILRGIADALDAAENQSISQPGALSTKIMPVAEPVQMSEPDSDLAQQPDDIFVPPLQLKLELLKKATGVENIYDTEEEEEGEQHSYPNMMTQIRRNAGLNPAVVSELGDDEPLES